MMKTTGKLEHFAILSNRKIAPDSFNCRIFCAEPAAIPVRSRGHASAENALPQNRSKMNRILLHEQEWVVDRIAPDWKNSA
jgi:hypothetical protein